MKYIDKNTHYSIFQFEYKMQIRQKILEISIQTQAKKYYKYKIHWQNSSILKTRLFGQTVLCNSITQNNSNQCSPASNISQCK